MYELYDTEGYSRMRDVAYLGTFKSLEEVNKFIAGHKFEGEPHVIRPDKLDHYLVKSAYSKTWQPSSETTPLSAAREFFEQQNTEFDQYYYVHVKHEYDDSVDKYRLNKRVAIIYHVIP